jgi:hypothetical protein
MELLRSRIRRSKLGELAYVAINALLPIVLLLLVHNFDSIYPALALVLLSKWRILALRPRFWWINIKANAVDLMVGISVVGLLYLSMASLPVQIVIMIGYGAWLLWLKPRSSLHAILLQAGTAQFLGITVLFSISTILFEPLVVLGCWIIGYATARHVVTSFEEDSVDFISCLWGLVVAQLGWLLYQWTIVYDVGLPVKIPQISLMLLVISFVVMRVYRAVKQRRLADASVRMNVIFAMVLLAIILIFARWDITI